MNEMYRQFGNRMNLRQQLSQGISQLKKQYADPAAEIQRMLNSGELSQEQYNQYAQIVRDNFR